MLMEERGYGGVCSRSPGLVGRLVLEEGDSFAARADTTSIPPRWPDWASGPTSLVPTSASKPISRMLSAFWGMKT